jgi:uncharacterized membrane protein YtjA (UPF0391 family)
MVLSIFCLRDNACRGQRFLVTPGNPRFACDVGQAKEATMLKWALIFFIVAIIAALFGFGGIAAGAATIAKWLFFIAIAIFLVFLVMGLMAGKAIF